MGSCPSVWEPACGGPLGTAGVPARQEGPWQAGGAGTQPAPWLPGSASMGLIMHYTPVQLL